VSLQDQYDDERDIRPCFTTQHQTCKTKTDFFLVSDRSCPKTDGLRPHHWPRPLYDNTECPLTRSDVLSIRTGAGWALM